MSNTVWDAAHGWHDGPELTDRQKLDLIGRVTLPEPNAKLECRTFYGVTTSPQGQTNWRRKYCRVCNSFGDWQVSLLDALADFNSHPTHEE